MVAALSSLLALGFGFLLIGTIRHRRMWWAIHKQNNLIRKLAWELYLKQMVMIGHVDIEELLFFCHDHDITDESPSAIELLQAVYYDSTDIIGTHLRAEDARVIIEEYILHREEIMALAYKDPRAQNDQPAPQQ